MSEVRRLPLPGQGTWEWQLHAACRGTDTSVFYHPENERGPARQRREQQAKQICGLCPVVASCLDWALTMREPYGVWGGLSTDEREALLAGPHRVAVG